MILAAVNDNLYNLVLVVHIVSMVVAFGAPVLSSVGGTGVPVATWRTSLYAIIASGALGIVLILLSDSVWEFSQAWISGAFLVWIAMAGVASGMVLPALKKGDEAKVTTGSQVLSVLLLAMLYLMVFKPGL